MSIWCRSSGAVGPVATFEIDFDFDLPSWPACSCHWGTKRAWMLSLLPQEPQDAFATLPDTTTAASETT